MTDSKIARSPLIQTARDLAVATHKLRFSPPVTHVYNPLVYAWDAHELYLSRYGAGPKEVIFLGMNPGPFGMVQTGVPFGEIAAVRDWMKIETTVNPPEHQHPRRPVQGFSCIRSEISGQRLWRLFANRFGAAENFFERHFVVNYCPLAFVEASGRNRTPDKLPSEESVPLLRICDDHLLRVLEILRPTWIIGIGEFAARRARLLAERFPVRVGQILHPSPASPMANTDWPGRATAQLQRLGVWS